MTPPEPDAPKMDASMDTPPPDAPTPGLVYVLACSAALGGFLFGYDTGVVSGAMLLLKKEQNLSAVWQELLVSSTVAAAALSSLAGGSLNGRLGRRRSIMLASFVFTVGGLILSLAPGREVLLVGRIVVGLGIGVASMSIPIYLAEVSPSHLRGRLVSINSLFITGGQFSAALVDGAFSYLQDGWRYMLGLSVAPAALQLLSFVFLPESPRWLLQRGRSQEARQVLSRIRGGRPIGDEYDAIRAAVQEEEADAGGLVILRILRHGPTRRALIVGCGLQMFQQLSGINTVMYYSATILQMAGVRRDRQAIWLSALTSASNFLFTLVGVWLVERVGRRKLTLFSLMGTGFSLSVLAVGFLLSAVSSPPVNLHPQNSTCSQFESCERCMLSPDCGFCYWENASGVLDSSCLRVAAASTDRSAEGSCSNQSWTEQAATGPFQAAGPFWGYNYCPSSWSWLVLLGLVLYLAFFAPGMGTTPWTINAEIYPLWARSTGSACSAGVNWICNVLVTLTFLHLAQFLTYYGVFFLYSGLVAVALLFVLTCLPETRGLQLEEVENLFSAGLCSSCCHSSPAVVQYSRVTLTSDLLDSDPE